MDKLKMHSPNLTKANIEKLAQLFPNCVTEAADGKGGLKKTIDFDLLRQELSDHLTEGPQERYQLNWPGKREALLTANAPIAKTLRPSTEESVGFYNTKNIFIEGDNLDALRLLQESYLGKVKMVYIDPPYNTGNDFIYNDDFSGDAGSFFIASSQKDEEGNKLVANPQGSGRFHSDWLSMMYARLKLARNLLKDDGVLLVSIDDNEQANLKRLCDEIFGEKNFIGLFVVNASPSGIDYGHLAKTHDYAIFYAKDIDLVVTNQLKEESKEFKYVDGMGGFNIYPLYNGNVAFNPKTRPNLYYPFYLNSKNNVSDDFYEISVDPQDGWVEVWPVVSRKEGIPRVWRWGKQKAREGVNNEIVGYKSESGEYRIVQKSRHTTKVIRSLLLDNDLSSRRGTGDLEKLFNGKIFSFPKPVELIRRFVEVGSGEEDLILDFFSGSSTTAQAVLQMNSEDGGNRRFIMIQLPEECDQASEAFKSGYKTIADIGRERIRRAGQQIKEKSSHPDWNGDIGFRVLKVDSSNMKEVYYTPDAVSQDLLSGLVDNIREDRTPEDLLFQVLLDWGVDLALPISQETIAGKTVFFVDVNALVVCFDKGIDEAFVKQIAEHQPLRVVFRDNGFASDSVKINVQQLFKLLSPMTEIKTL